MKISHKLLNTVKILKMNRKKQLDNVVQIY